LPIEIVAHLACQSGVVPRLIHSDGGGKAVGRGDGALRAALFLLCATQVLDQPAFSHDRRPSSTAGEPSPKAASVASP
jgi:hypothetical protein